MTDRSSADRPPDDPQADRTPKRPFVGGAARIVAIYVVVSALWILVSDTLVERAVSDPHQVALVSTIKGWLFVALTGGLLYALIRRLVGRINAMHARVGAEQAAKFRALRLLDIIADRSTDAIYMKDTEGRYQLFNRQAGWIVGREAATVVGQDDWALFPPQEAQRIQNEDRQIMANGEVCTFEEVITTQRGRRTFLTTKGPYQDSSHRLGGVFGITRDITDRKEAERALERSEAQYRSLFENILGGFAYHEVVYDSAGRPCDFIFLAVNGQFDQLTGLGNVIGRRMTEILPDLNTTDPDLFRIYFRVAASGRPERFERFIKPLGRWFSISAFSTDRDHFAVLFDNITERKKAEDKIQFLAYHDPLTGLPNRLLAEDRMRMAMAYADRAATKAAILIVDLDNFKSINDTAGHHFGDELLKQVGRRLAEAMRPTDTVARIGGDEFIVVVGEVPDVGGIGDVAEGILELMTEPLSVDGRNLVVSASIGVALFPQDGRDFETLLKKASAAVYHAKEIGRNTYHVFDRSTNTDTDEQLRLRNDLRRALERDEFVLHYQPQIDLPTGAVIGAEALVRWNHPDMGLVPPGRFIPIAEESGLIIPLGEWVLRQACRQLAAWNAAGRAGLTMAVNLSALQFKRGDLERTVAAAITEAGIAPSCLELELTESILIKDVDTILAMVERLKSLGIKLSIDDFGTGYSSLAYLKRFRIDKLKIDQSFIRDMVTDTENATLVRTILQMAEGLNLRTIAEGVEDAATADYLRHLGCQEGQGYLFAKPLPSADFLAFLGRN